MIQVDGTDIVQVTKLNPADFVKFLPVVSSQRTCITVREVWWKGRPPLIYSLRMHITKYYFCKVYNCKVNRINKTYYKFMISPISLDETKIKQKQTMYFSPSFSTRLERYTIQKESITSGLAT